MKRAMDWHSQSLIDADVADKTHPFQCPTCWTDVILAQGEVNAAYFRHKDQSLRCPDYQPGSSTSAQWSNQHDPRLTLRLSCVDDKWTLYFKLPEIQPNEIARGSQNLKGMNVALQHRNNRITQVNGYELWPGSGTSTVTVNPANPIDRIFTQGDWPKWDLKRWNNKVQNIPRKGAVFSQDRGGDYVLCTESRPLYLGRSAVFVAPEQTLPPKWISSRKLDTHDGFAAWHFTAPRAAETSYSRWLTKFGTTIAKVQDPSRILTPPIDYRNADMHVIPSDDCAIIAPSSIASAIVAQSSLDFQPLRLDMPGELVRLSGSFRTARLRTRSGDELHVTKENLPDPGELSVHSQHWNIVIGSNICRPYSSVDIDEIREPRLEFDTELALRFTATVQYPGKTIKRLANANSYALRDWLERVESSASLLEVDAGSFGIIRINSVRQPEPTQIPDDPADPSPSTSRDNTPEPHIQHAETSTINGLKRSRWSYAYMALRAGGGIPGPYWSSDGRRESAQDWRIRR